MKPLEKGLPTKKIGKNIIYLETVESTNTIAKQLAKEGAPEGTIVLAEQQTQGRGRRGRSWISPPETGIWMSMVLRPTVAADKVSLLTLLVGLAMRNAIAEVTDLEVGIKWPNDLVVGQKKVCGILSESSLGANGTIQVIAGVGVNVNMEAIDPMLPYATSLLLEGGSAYSREDIIAKFCIYFEEMYETFESVGGIQPFIALYNQYCVNVKREVCIIEEESWQGYVERINEQGALCVRKADLSIVEVVAGEVSVRGLYGYV